MRRREFLAGLAALPVAARQRHRSTAAHAGQAMATGTAIEARGASASLGAPPPPGRWAGVVFQQINVSSNGYAGRGLTSALQSPHADFPGGGSPQTQQSLPCQWEPFTDYFQEFPWPPVVGFMSPPWITGPSFTGLPNVIASLYLGTGVGSMTDFDGSGKPLNKKAVTAPSALTSLPVPAGSWPGAPLMPDNTAAVPAVPIIAWHLDVTPLTDITAGLHDTDTIIPVAQQCKAWPASSPGNPAYPGQPGGQVLIRLMHEFNGTWADYCPANLGETTTDFVNAWRHIVQVFHNQGATNARWVWNPNICSPGAGTAGPGGYANTSGSVALMYPGDAWVDYVGIDGYNKFVPTWRTFHDVFQPTYDFITAGDAFTGGPISASKPVIICETSSYEDDMFTSPPQTKAQYIADIATVVPASMPLVQGVMVWHDATDALEWLATSSAGAVTAWNALAHAWTGRPPVIQGVT